MDNESQASVNNPPGNYDRVVRCSEGHLYTTIWVPLISFKAVRLGSQRYQHCPVGQHWSLVERVNEAELTTPDLEQARQHHDVRMP